MYAGEGRGQEHAGVADVRRLGQPAERHRGGHRGDPGLVAVVQVRDSSVRTTPPVTALTRTLGAHSIASDCGEVEQPGLGGAVGGGARARAASRSRWRC